MCVWCVVIDSVLLSVHSWLTSSVPRISFRCLGWLPTHRSSCHSPNTHITLRCFIPTHRTNSDHSCITSVDTLILSQYIFGPIFDPQTLFYAKLHHPVLVSFFIFCLFHYLDTQISTHGCSNNQQGFVLSPYI